MKKRKLIRRLAVVVNDLIPWADRNADEMDTQVSRDEHTKLMRSAKAILEKFDKYQRKAVRKAVRG